MQKAPNQLGVDSGFLNLIASITFRFLYEKELQLDIDSSVEF